MLRTDEGGIFMTLGERIAQARKQAGLSQEQLGEKLGKFGYSVRKKKNSH